MIRPGHAIVTCGVERHLPPEGAPEGRDPRQPADGQRSRGQQWGLGAVPRSSFRPALRHDKPRQGVSHQQDEQGLDEEPAFHGLPHPPPPGVPRGCGEGDDCSYSYGRSSGALLCLARRLPSTILSPHLASGSAWALVVGEGTAEAEG